MSISTEEVTRIAKLARLQFDDQGKEKLQTELSSILDYVEQVSKVQGNLSDVELENPETFNLMRNDVAEPAENPEEFLAQAPERQGRFIKVKSILE
jgi:aspartyl-tRNA(Asn)/glutamyl-tRNA(Gln) amidotransferase subunit C